MWYDLEHSGSGDLLSGANMWSMHVFAEEDDIWST